MTEDLYEELKEDFALFIEAGFVAVKQLDEQSAKRLFRAAYLLDPDSPAPHVGMGYIALNKLEIKKATKIFQVIVDNEPDHHLARTFLGICYLLTKSKRKEGEEMIRETIKKTDDPTVVELGKISLDWSDKDLKKVKSPFFGSE